MLDILVSILGWLIEHKLCQKIKIYYRIPEIVFCMCAVISCFSSGFWDRVNGGTREANMKVFDI